MSDKDLQKVLDKLSKKYDTPVGFLDKVGFSVDSISTKNIAIDWITGIGGLPLGRTVELFGPPSCGKTTLALQTAAEAQAKGLQVLYLDFEQAMDRDYASSLGVDISKMLITQPDSLEDGADMALELLEMIDVGLIIFDSVAAMVPRALQDADSGKDLVAPLARRMGPFTQRLNPILKQKNCCAIFLNHIRDMIGVATRPGFAPQRTTPGGVALKYYASMRIEFALGAQHKEEIATALSGEKDKVATGRKVFATCVKNKLGPPYRKVELRMMYGSGFSQAFSVVEILKNHKVIRDSGGGVYRIKESVLQADWMDFSDKNGFHVRGLSNLINRLAEQPDTLATWVQVAESVMRSKKEEDLPYPAELMEGAKPLNLTSEAKEAVPAYVPGELVV